MNFRPKLNYVILLIVVTYVITFTFFDQRIFEWSQEIDNRIRTNKNLQLKPEAKKLFKLNGDNIPRDKNGKKKPVILHWRPFFGYLDTESDICDSQCVLTYDQSSMSVADAVVFHCVETSDFVDRYPWKHRHLKQRWVWMCMEPPWNVRFMFEKTLSELGGVFNWTMTYRTDSDVFANYVREIPQISRDELDVLIEGKDATSLVAWVVSNCVSIQRRNLMEEISNYVSVDVFGQCVNKRIDSVDDVVSKYKFYLSFENSECKDYITEKFWHNALKCGTVPVVMGPPRSEYELVAPPNSFIHVDDFGSVKELAEYLKKLDNHDELYRKYFEWRLDPDWMKKTGQLPSNANALRAYREGGFKNGECGLCQKLRETGDDEVDVVESLEQWWFGEGYRGFRDFPVCKRNTGDSGYSHHWRITLAYTSGFALVLILTWCFAHKPFKGIYSPISKRLKLALR